MMKDAPQRCPHCGKPVSSEALMGLCPECLLEAGSATGTGATPMETEEGRFVPPTPEELGWYFPQLEILELLGHGGMGAVYKARQKELDRVVALKILPPGISHDRSFSQRFTREAQALARLNHPHIVTLYDFGQADGLFYFFMEYVDGMNLRQLLQSGHLSPDEALAIVPQICDALQYAHDRGIVHRDIKPENLLLGKDGQVKVADFGVARIIAGETGEKAGGQLLKLDVKFQELTPDFLGTPQYMAPEQRSRPGEVDHRADIYSLGVVFYQLLTGELPGRPMELPSRKVEIDVRLDQVVLRALEQEPERRYHQASGMKAEVETIATTRQRVAVGKTGTRVPLFAGFWRRTAAVLMDYALVSTVAFPLVLLLAVVAPGSIVVETPFGLGTAERVVEDHSSESGGGHRLVETTVLGKWRYLYLERLNADGQRETSRQRMDPETRLPLRTTSAGTLYLGLLLLYWAAMESGYRQASVGKMILGIHVADRQGERLSLGRAFGRNLSKIFSLLPLGVGFFMVGIDREGQGLHDKMANCLVVRDQPGTWTREKPVASLRERLRRAAVLGALFCAVITIPLTSRAYSERTSARQMEQLKKEARNQVEEKLRQARRRLNNGQSPLVPRILEALEREGREKAVAQFNAADWSTHLLFAPGSALALGEDELMALPWKERERRHDELLKEVTALGKLTRAVTESGGSAAANHDLAHARACFESLKVFGRRLDRPEFNLLLRLFAQSVEKKALEQLAKLPMQEGVGVDLKFGPVVERTLGDMAAKSEIPELLDFKTGALFFQSEVMGEEGLSDQEAFVRKLRQYGVHVGGTLLPSDRGLIGWELATVPESPDAWGRLAAEAVHRALAEVPLRSPVILHGTGTLPAAYLFKTRTGEEGVLQISGFSEKPPGVRIRYKLLEGLLPVTPPVDDATPTMDHPVVHLKAWPGEVYSVDGEECDLDDLYGKLNKLAFQQSVDRKVIPITASAAKGVDPSRIRFLAETARAFGINSRETLAGNPAAVPPSEVRQPRFVIRAEAGEGEEADTFTVSHGDSVRLAKKVWLDESDVRFAEAATENGHRVVRLKLTINGTRKFAALTHAFLHQRVALVFDGKVLADPVIQVPIYGGMLSNHFSLSEAEEAALLALLNGRSATLVPDSVDAAEETAAEPPQLRALKWQSWTDSGEGRAWLPSGEPVADETGLPPPAGLKVERASEDRILCLWFSHPLFDAQSVGEIAFFDQDGKTAWRLPDFALRRLPATAADQRGTGWMTAAVHLDYKGPLPPRATVSLRYSVGSWKQEGSLAVTFQGSHGLSTGVIVNAPGEDVDGNAFVQISREKRSRDDEERQFSAVAVLTDGERREPNGGGIYGTGKISVERISFPASLAQIESFQIRNRPVRRVAIPVILNVDVNNASEEAR